MPANLTLAELAERVADGTIDTVLTCVVDMQGRLMGKRFHAQHFLDSGKDETHGCNYLLATDMEMFTVPGYASTSWEAGYGDYVHKPDLTTLRRVPWLPGTAMVMCDLLDHHSHEEVSVSPRAILKRQIARAEAMGFTPLMATELEFFLFEEGYDALADRDWRDLKTRGRYNIDYHIQGTTKDELLMRDIRNGLYGAGIIVENTKGEAETGQHEVNVRYAAGLETADGHAIVKNAVKEMAEAHGRAVTFMAKYATDRAGSSSHVHQSLAKDGKNAFHDAGSEHGMSDVMRHYLAGQLRHASEITCLLAPYVNSYKRFTEGLFAPTKAVWSTDNRTAGYRVCGAGTKGVRVECRVGGADLNPHLALAALLAAGLDGIENALDLEPEMSGDVYGAADVREIPGTLRDAAKELAGSDMLKSAFGEDVVAHYHRAALWEIEQNDKAVTDWDLRRGFERA